MRNSLISRLTGKAFTSDSAAPAEGMAEVKQAAPPRRLIWQVLWSVLPVAVLVFLALWVLGSEASLNAVRTEFEERATRQANQSAFAVSLRLRMLLEGAETLAGNDLVGEALDPAFEGAAYTKSLFGSLRLPGPREAMISLIDSEGRAVLSNGSSRSFAAAEWLKTIGDGKRFFQISPLGLVIAVPVLRNHRVAGAIIVQYGGRSLPEIFEIPTGDEEIAIREKNGRVVFSTDSSLATVGLPYSVPDGAEWVSAGVAVPGFPGLVLESAETHEKVLTSVFILRFYMVVDFVLNLLLLTLGIWLAAYIATKPLSRFINSSQKIGLGGDLALRIPPSGSREFHALAASFNDTLDRLGKTLTSRDYVDSILNSMNEMLIVTDSSGNIRTVNRAVPETLGYNGEQLIGQPISILYPDLSGPELPIAEASIEREEEFIGIESDEFSHRIKRVPVRVSTSTLSGAGGRGSGIIYMAQNMTAQRLAEADAKRAQERLADAIESMSDGLVLFDKEDRLVQCNKRYLDLYRNSAAHCLPGTSFEDLMRSIGDRGDVRDAVGREAVWLRERMVAHRNPGAPFEQELQDGRLVRITERKMASGGTVGVYSDITELKMRERALRTSQLALLESESRLKTAERLAVMGHWEWDYERDSFTHISQEAADIFGINPSEFKGSYEQYLKSIHPEDREQVRKDHMRISAKPERYECEFRIVRPDGQVRHIYSVAEPMTGGSFRGRRAVGAYQDITERREAELAVQRSEARLSAILEHSPASIYLKGLEGRYLVVNREFLRTNQLQKDDVIGKTASEIYPAWLARQFTSHDREILESQTAISLEINDQPRQDGLHSYAVTKFPILDASGKNIAIGGIETDITERKRGEEQLKIYMEALERSNRDLEEFASVASHDLQEPLRKVQAFGARLNKSHGAELGDEGRDSLARMSNAAQRMQDLISDLLAFSRVRTKAESYELVDLNQVVRGVMTDLELQIEESAGRIDLNKLPEIEADSRQMRQLFQNLLGNALKFRRKDVPPAVEISASWSAKGQEGDAADGFCVISVQDNGIGIDDKDQDRVFEVFQRLHGRAQYPGTGMGLAICRRIAENHGGTIAVESKVGEGTLFRVRLPLHQRRSGDDAA